MAAAGQHDHLVAMHSDVADGAVIILRVLQATNLLGCISLLDYGNDLQVCIKED